MNFYITYNGKFIDMRKKLSSAMNLCKRKGLKNDYYNQLYIIDGNGDTYDPVTGEKKDVE